MSYYINQFFSVTETHSVNSPYEKELRKSGNWFDSREQAENKAKEVRKIIKGE